MEDTEESSDRMEHPALSSSLIELVTHARQAFSLAEALSDGCGFRRLSGEEVAVLQQHGNFADSWDDVWVNETWDRDSASRVRGCRFLGKCLLGKFREQLQAEHVRSTLPSGLYNCTFAGVCVLEDECLVQDVCMVSDALVGARAVLMGCGSVTGGSRSSFGNGQMISVGVSTKGRAVPACYGIDYPTYCALALDRSNMVLFASIREHVDRVTEAVSSEISIIGQHAQLHRCSRVVNAVVGPHAKMFDAVVEESTVMSAVDAITKIDCAFVHRSIIHERCEVSNRATVRESVLMEFSSAVNSAKVEHSILGPDSGVGSGECGHCLLGPFVGFHHQSLLIAALWPMGRGNVAYGANVGSNHTGRSNDQEIVVGEGVFFGLGCVIKFPFDCSLSPYSLIASGTACLPQKFMFPFSLLAAKADDELQATQSGLNEIKPGWVLYDSLYTVERNEQKFRSRRTARHCATDHGIFRPAIIDMLLDARSRLRKPVERHALKTFYLEGELDGLGKNVCSEAARRKGEEAYTRFIRRYALQGLLEHVSSKAQLNDEASSTPPSTRIVRTVHGADFEILHPSSTDWWWHQRSVLAVEYGSDSSSWCVRTMLTELLELETEYVQEVRRSKQKDYDRGSRVIADYNLVHESLDEDPVIAKLEQRLQQMRERVDTALFTLTA